MKKVVFLLSSERSGSTLLQSMLNEHPQICAPPELWMLAFDTIDEWHKKKAKALNSVQALYEQCNQPFNKNNFLKSNSGLSTVDIYSKLIFNGNIVVDKTPAYANDINILKKTKKINAHYIWLIRHPLGVINSKINRALKQSKDSSKIKYYSYLGDEFLHNALKKGLSIKACKRERKWVKQNINIGFFLNCIDQEDKTIIFFEDLLQNPKKELSTICNDLNIQLDEKMVTPSFDKIHIDPGLGDQNIKTYRSVEPEKASEWSKKYTEKQLSETTLLLYQNLKTLAT